MTSNNWGNHGRLGAGFAKFSVQEELGRVDYLIKEASGILEKYRKAEPESRFKNLLNVDVQVLVQVRKHLVSYRDSLGV